IVVSWTLLKSVFSNSARSKGWRRVAFSQFCFWVFSRLNRRQVRVVFGETLDTYNGFMKSIKMEPLVEELDGSGRLLWVGPKRTEHVVLYFHGGGFLFGGLDAVPKLWIHMQDNLKQRGKPLGVALLNYTLVPDATFPTTLKESVIAVQHLIDSGTKPENIIIAGDSAGGAMVHGLLSHMLHPLDGIPELKLSAPLAGAYLMSPWVIMRDDKILHDNVNRGDILDPPTVVYWGAKVLKDVPAEAVPYLEGTRAPSNWFEGIDKVVKHILISAGEEEVLRDSIVSYAKTVEKFHPDAAFYMDEGCIHVEPFIFFAVGQPDRAKLIPFILEWLDKTFL
ncbi:Alpha/Beta hydrolase protein, partial [Gymnopilus junonius]